MSGFVNINLVYGSARYTVDVASDAEYDELLTALRSSLLGSSTKPDMAKKHELILRGSIRLAEGATVEVRTASGEGLVRGLKESN